MKILIAQVNPTIGDLERNTSKILDAIQQGKEQNAELVLFPELVISGYPPEDFLLMPHFISAVERQLEEIVAASSGITVVVGTVRPNPSSVEKPLYNSAAVIQNESLLGYHDKTLLPTYDVFDEKRYFEPGKEFKLFTIGKLKIAVTICEDIWHHSGEVPYTSYGVDPIEKIAELKPDLVLNLSGSPYNIERHIVRREIVRRVAMRLNCPLVLCNQIGGNDSLIFDGNSLAANAKGECLALAKGFQEELLLFDTDENGKAWPSPTPVGEELYDALVLGLKDYCQKTGFTKVCFGLSGGIDSSLVACLAVAALGSENVYAVTMPSRYSSKGSVTDSELLAERLGIELQEVPIELPFKAFLDLLEPAFDGEIVGVTRENLQPRIRGMILMAFSNKYGHLLLSTGNKSELAMGYATLYGDMCGGLGVISDLTKTQVYSLSKWINRDEEIIPNSIINKPPSAELRPNQLDSDSLPDYSVVDTVLNDYIVHHISPDTIAEVRGISLEVVNDLVRRIHRNEYKRRQGAPGLRVTQKAFSVGRRFPIAQKWV